MGIPNRKQETRAIRLMQTVDDREAFYFYEAIGKPTGTSVRNINDFLQTIKTVSLESLAFHLERGDFQSWITKALGDTKLAGNLGRISISSNPTLRTDICTAIEMRMNEVKREPFLTLSVANFATPVPAEK